MQPIDPSFSDDDITALEDWCDRLSQDEQMPLVTPDWVDGYLTALVCGPRLVMPSEYLPAMFGEALMKVMSKVDDFEAFMGLLIRRWNSLADELDPSALVDDPDEIRLNPLLTEYSQDEIEKQLAEGIISTPQAMALAAGAGWARGFGQAMLDFEDDWEVFEEGTAENEAFEFNVSSVLLLAQTDPARVTEFCLKHYGDANTSRDDMIAQAMLSVQDLRLLWIQHPVGSVPVRTGTKQGRNEPCACGSGQKYKKCCGAPTGLLH